MEWLIFAIGSALFAGMTAILAKVGIQDVDSTLATALRTVVVLAFSWLMVFVAGKQHGISSISPKSWTFLALSGVATGLSWLCYFRALQDGPASVVVPVDKLSIVVTVVFAVLFLHEQLSLQYLIGFALVVGGTLLMVL